MTQKISDIMITDMIIEQNKVLMQIGTNNGNDDFNKIVKISKPSKLILVEPNVGLNDEIYKNYKGIDMKLENVAITEVHKDEVELVIPEHGPNGRAVNGFGYGHGCYSLLPLDDWGDKFRSIKSEGVTFNDLCKKYDITDVHYLQIDTEGYDANIIKSIDFDSINIDFIRYEWWGFTEDMFSRHDDRTNCGINGMNSVKKHLTSLGYDVKSVRCPRTNEINMEAIKKQ